MPSKKYQQLAGAFPLDLRNIKSDSKDTFLLSAKNVICRDGYIELRKHINKVVPFNDPVEFLYDFEDLDIIVAATDDTIYLLNHRFELIDSQDGFSDGNWVGCVFNHRLYLANSLDPSVMIWSPSEGTYNIDTVDVTGAGTVTFSFISVVNSQLVFGLANKMEFWYLPPGNVTGQLSLFDLTVAIGTTRIGGNLVQITNVPRDSGMGMQDYVAMFTDKGEIIVYQCTDFSDPTKITYHGTYLTMPFIGYNFIQKYMNDLLLMTIGGVTTFQDVVSAGVSVSTDRLFSAPINDSWVENNFNLNGYKSLIVPQEDFIMFNIPKGNNKYNQWVVDLSSHKWSSFNSIDPTCFMNHDGRLYFGKADGIYEYTNDGIPSDQFIISEIQTSYSNFNTINSKGFKLFNARVLATGNLNVNYSILKDLEDTTYYDFVSEGGDLVPSVPGDDFYFALSEDETDPIDQEHQDLLAYWWIDNENYDNLPNHRTAYWAVGDSGNFSEQTKWHSGTGYARNFSLRLIMKTNNISYKFYDLTYHFDESTGAL